MSALSTKVWGSMGRFGSFNRFNRLFRLVDGSFESLHLLAGAIGPRWRRRVGTVLPSTLSTKVQRGSAIKAGTSESIRIAAASDTFGN